MIKTVNLTKKFGSLVAVDNLNLNIPEGEIFGFLGPNGAGKTTTVKLLSGLLKPDSGKIYLDGYDLEEEPIRVKKFIGLLPEHPFLYRKLTGKEYLCFIADLYGLDFSANNKIIELLEMFNLSNVSDDLIESYSLGMQQKLTLAGIILREPKIFFLDEPLVGLDPQTARLVKEIFVKSCIQGKTIFLCTHILEVAEKLCHRIGIIQQGKLLAMGTIEQLREQARTDGDLEDIFFKLTESGSLKPAL